MRKLALTTLLCLCTVLGFAGSFTAADQGFSITLNSKWKANNTSGTEILNLRSGANKINAIPLEKCNNSDCLEKIIANRIKQVKAKKFKLIKNTYSGEEIKRTEFSTLDPLLSFSYIAEGTPYTEGFFTSGGKGYKIEIVGLPYAEAELNLSFLSPKPKEVEDLPVITEEEPFQEENILAPQVEETKRQTLSETFSAKQEIQKAKEAELTIPTKIYKLIFIIFIYLLVFVGFFSFNLFFAQTPDKTPTNPKSFYPIRGTRLYGSPDLFLRFYDSQGQNVIVTAQRWGSFLMVMGVYSAIFFTLAHFVLSAFAEQGLDTHKVLLNTTMSLCYLFAIFGLIFTVTGKVLDILFPPAIYIYNDKGSIAFKIVRRGSGLLNYAYLVLSEADTVVYRLETPKIFLLRKWMLFDKQGELAIIKEDSLPKALGRKLLGHLGGTLRASYLVRGKNESKGQIISLRNIRARFQVDIDKPQAFPATAMMITAAVISVVDRDKYYPWFN